MKFNHIHTTVSTLILCLLYLFADLTRIVGSGTLSEIAADPVSREASKLMHPLGQKRVQQLWGFFTPVASVINASGPATNHRAH